MALDLLIRGALDATTGIDSGAGTAVAAPAPAEGDNVFARVLDAVNGATANANEATASMLSGTGEIHDAMIALQQADLALQFAVQIRNKLVNAYQEISRMPV
jgi:flagellar hook-basal body complex protein FliE